MPKLEDYKLPEAECDEPCFCHGQFDRGVNDACLCHVGQKVTQLTIRPAICVWENEGGETLDGG